MKLPIKGPSHGSGSLGTERIRYETNTELQEVNYLERSGEKK